jgi:2-iminobutanoate/2-iminopropanoate deaminase
MEHRELITRNAPAPVGPYSQAVSANGFIFVSGQIGIDPIANTMADGTASQTHQAIRNIAAILENAGSGLNKVVRADVFVADMNDFAAVNQIYAEYFSAVPKPARQLSGAATLPKNARIEISCVALT